MIEIGPVSESQVSNHGDSDLFSFLSAMHLNHHQIPVTQQLITSRKRKILDHGDRGSLGGSSSGKFNGLRPPPTLRRNSEDDLPLHTPQCSQSGMRNLTFWIVYLIYNVIVPF